MGRGSNKYGLQLSFGTITCERCGGERLLARECPECNARPKPHEVQYDLHRRARVIADFRKCRQGTDTSAEPNVAELQAEFDRTLKKGLKALSGASRRDRKADSLVVAFSRFDQLVTSWRNPLPRPDRNRGRIVGKALSVFAEGLECFVEAVEAPDMLTAQELEARGNQQFKRAESLLGEIDELDEAAGAFSGNSSFQVMNHFGRSLRVSVASEASLRELDAKLISEVEWDVASEGVGLQVQTVKSIALSAFDYEMFTQVLTVATTAVGAKGAALGESSEWTRCHARAAAFLASAVASVYQVVSADDTNDFEIAHKAVEAVATWRDGVLKHALATMQASSFEEYQKLIRKGGGEVIRRASLAFPELLLDENLNRSLRNAGGHAGVDVTEQGIRIGDEEFPIEIFIDRVLAYLETTVAAFFGVDLSMARLVVRYDYNNYLTPRDRDAAVSLFLGTFGLSCELMEVDGESATIRASGDEPDWLTLAAGLSAMLPSVVSWAHISVTSDGVKRKFSTSLERYRMYADDIASASLKETVLKMSAIVASSRLDGDSPWSGADWGRAVKAMVPRGEDDDLRAWVKNLRELRQNAREAEQADVVNACEYALAGLRR